VTDAVMSEVTAWQGRPLEAMYPVVFFDALRVKIREDAVVRNKAIYLALGVLADGTRDILGLWIESPNVPCQAAASDLRKVGACSLRRSGPTVGIAGSRSAAYTGYPYISGRRCRNSVDGEVRRSPWREVDQSTRARDGHGVWRGPHATAFTRLSSRAGVPTIAVQTSALPICDVSLDEFIQ
jgi:hypothetical protein